MTTLSPKVDLASAVLILVGLGMFAYGLSSFESAGGGSGFGGSSFGRGEWSIGYSAKAQVLMVFGAVLVGFGAVLRAHRGADVFQAAVDLLRSINKKVIAREWLIFLSCFFVGLALIPPRSRADAGSTRNSKT